MTITQTIAFLMGLFFLQAITKDLYKLLKNEFKSTKKHKVLIRKCNKTTL